MQSRSEWEIYGNFKRTCWGHVTIHPIRPWWWALEIYTVIGICVFAVEHENYPAWQLAIGLTLGCLCVCSTFKTTLADPGICPRPSYDQALENRKEIEQTKLYRKIIVIKGVEMKCSYCYKCNMYRPPESGHCSICDSCIQGWDHHCPVFGGCIGYKNKFWFYCMIFFMPACWVFLLGSGISYCWIGGEDYQWYQNKTMCTALVGFAGAVFLPPILIKCRTCDKVHSRPIPPSHRFTSGTTGNLSEANYPRQPTRLIPSDKEQEPEVETNLDDKSNHNDVVINITT